MFLVTAAVSLDTISSTEADWMVGVPDSVWISSQDYVNRPQKTSLAPGNLCLLAGLVQDPFEQGTSFLMIF